LQDVNNAGPEALPVSVKLYQKVKQHL